jgi:preprotein translocase subunit SecY
MRQETFFMLHLMNKGCMPIIGAMALLLYPKAEPEWKFGKGFRYYFIN